MIISGLLCQGLISMILGDVDCGEPARIRYKGKDFCLDCAKWSVPKAEPEYEEVLVLQVMLE